MRHPMPKWQRQLVLITSLIMLLSSISLPPASESAAQAGLPTSKVAEGIYYVYATREGLVGGWTSGGHQIVENDFFVALPSCTPQNCPRGATRGNMTNCGSKCYVKVVNPVTNLCRVEPIKDVGPWFTVDDWWNPTNVRYLNTLSTNPQTLPQGYTAADAARDGLNVGYGIASNGIGIDNTLEIGNRPPRAVGNRAAIDLADGTWRNLQLTSPDTIGSRIYVHMLWQTGGDPAAEALTCGHQLNQPGGTMYPLPVPSTTPLPYPPVTATVVVTPTTGGTARVVNTGGAGLRCRTGPSTGATIITTMPEGAQVAVRGLATAGWLPITCNGQDGWASTDYLSITLATPTATSEASPSATSDASPTATSEASPTGEPGTPAPGSPPATEPEGSPTVTPTDEPPTLTPTPTATPTVLPVQTGQAIVTGTGGVGLRCRTGPSTGATQIGNMAEGTTVTLRGPSIAGWLPVTCGGQEGWASASYLQITVPPGTPVTPTATAATVTPTPSPTSTATATSTASPTATTTPAPTGSARVVGTGGVGLRCRTAPSTAGSQITTMAEGSVVPVTGLAIAGWYPVTCAGQAGWASGDYLQVTSTPPPATTTPTASPSATASPAMTGTVVNTGGTSVRCRTEATTASGIIVNLPEGAIVTVRGAQQGSWYPVRCNGRDGFVHADYLAVSTSPAALQALAVAEESGPGTEPPGANAPENEPAVTESVAPTEVEPIMGSAWIASDTGGAINCRADASTDSTVLTTLAHGTWVETRGAPTDGWQQVGCVGIWGYVSTQFLSSTEPLPMETPTSEEASITDGDGGAPPEAPASELPAGSHPIFGTSNLTIVDALDQSGTAAWTAVDGLQDSTWSGTSLTLDLGTTHHVTGVRWLTSSDSLAEITVLASTDGDSWWTVGVQPPRQAWTWEGAWLESSVRFVRLQSPDWMNLAEVEIWGIPAEAETTDLPTRYLASIPVMAASNRAPIARIGGTIGDGRRRHRSSEGSRQAAIGRRLARHRRNE